jgi:hypothetical protein
LRIAPPPSSNPDTLEQRFPGHEGRGHKAVVVRVGPRGGHGGREAIGLDLERLRVGERLAQRGRQGLGVLPRLAGPRGQNRLTAAAAARIRMIPP